jgi:drug/metabolite transporter superfamily protein YnfA
MGGIVFRTRSRRVLLLTDPDLLKLAVYVTIIFKKQKNGKKMDARSEQQSGNAYLCPILCWGSAVQRIIPTIPDWTKQTTLCSIALDDKIMEISYVFVRKVF